MIEMLTVDDVAQATGFSAYTVRAAIRDGDLQASKMRGRYRIHPDQVAAWIDNSTVRGTGASEGRDQRPAARPPRPAPPSTSAREAMRAMRRSAA